MNRVNVQGFCLFVCFFFQAEDGIRDSPVTGVQTCALPICAVFTFGVKGGYDAGIKVVEAVNLFSHLANVGDTRSLIIHPASTTHRQLNEEQQIAAGAGPDVIRLSIGLETIEDIISDLDQALSKTLKKG